MKNYQVFLQYFYLIGWQASDQESIVASKTVVSPH